LAEDDSASEEMKGSVALSIAEDGLNSGVKSLCLGVGAAVEAVHGARVGSFTL
jgi:hypothetical protein